MGGICGKCYGSRAAGACICGTSIEAAAERKYTAMFFNLETLYRQLVAERDALRKQVNHATNLPGVRGRNGHKKVAA